MVFEDELNGFVEKISQGLNPKAILVFGSVAKDAATEYSDVDLMIIIDTDMSYFERTFAVRKCIGITTIPIDILAFTPEEVEEGRAREGSIICEILNSGRVIYGTA